MKDRMKIIAEDDKKITMLDYFEGKPIRFYMEKSTGTIYTNADDMAKIMGYANQKELLSTDAALDALLEHTKINPGEPFLKTSDDL